MLRVCSHFAGICRGWCKKSWIFVHWLQFVTKSSLLAVDLSADILRISHRKPAADLQCVNVPQRFKPHLHFTLVFIFLFFKPKPWPESKHGKYNRFLILLFLGFTSDPNNNKKCVNGALVSLNGLGQNIYQRYRQKRSIKVVALSDIVNFCTVFSIKWLCGSPRSSFQYTHMNRLHWVFPSLIFLRIYKRFMKVLS